MKTIRVTLQIDLEPLSAEALAQSGAEQLPEDCRPTGTDEDLEEISAIEIGDMIADHLMQDDGELWAGSGIYAKLAAARAYT